MRRNFLKILILFLVFAVSCVLLLNIKLPHKYKILKVVSADEFYIDFNKNSKIDENEHVKLANVFAFNPIKTNYTLNISKDLGLKIQDMLLSGYLAHAWAINNLEGREVLVLKHTKCKKDEICKVDIYYNNEDYSKFLLKNGLGYVSKYALSKEYFYYYNSSEVINNANEISKLNFVILNLKSNIAHKLNCKHIKDLTLGELVLFKKLDNKTRFCKNCFELTKKLVNNDFDVAKSNGIYKKSLNKTFDNIDFYIINPLEYDRPSASLRGEFTKRLIKEINLAKSSIDVALYGLGEQKDVLSALRNAKNRGVKLRFVVDKSKNIDSAYPLTSVLVNEFGAVEDKNDTLMHNKFFIFDDKTVLTGSLNISSTGSAGYNANVAVFVRSESIAKIYKKEFEQMYNSKFSISKEHYDFNLKDSNIKVYFSPQDNIYQNVLSDLIKNAKSTIYVSAFYLTYKDMLYDLVQAKNRGVDVLVVLDATSANNFKDRLNFLRNSSIPVIVENWGGKNHEKTIVIDKKTIVLGSCNFSKNGFSKNDENVLVINNPKMAEFYSDYYLYLFNSIDKKYLTLIPRAESLESKNSCYDGLDNDYDGKIDFKDEGCKN